MSHEIRETDSLMYVGETPWHGIGNAIPAGTVLSAYDAMVAAGLNWDVYQRPALCELSDGSMAPITTEVRAKGGEVVEKPMKVNCRRLPNGKEQKLGIVGGGYTIMQNAEAFRWFNPFVEKGEAAYHTAGSLKGGRIVWVLAELNRQPAQITANDTIRKFLLLTHSHDSSKAIQVGFTPIRVVCWNTLSMATVNDAEDVKTQNQMVKIKHTKHKEVGLSAVRETINAADAKFEATAEQYRRLARFAISPTDLKRYMTLCLCKASPKANPNKPSTTMVHNVEDIVGGGDRSNTPLIDRMKGGYDGTLWGAYNLVSEYLTWESGREKKTRREEADNRLSLLWLGGTSSTVIAFALQEAMKMAV